MDTRRHAKGGQGANVSDSGIADTVCHLQLASPSLFGIHTDLHQPKSGHRSEKTHWGSWHCVVDYLPLHCLPSKPIQQLCLLFASEDCMFSNQLFTS